MAVRTWLSTSDDLTGTAAGTGLAWSGDTVPIAGDYVRFPKEASKEIVRNRNGLAAVALAGWYVEDGCPIPFGSSGSPIHIDADEIVWFGDGPAYVQHTGTASTNQVLYAPVAETGMLVLSGNATQRIIVASGNLMLSHASYAVNQLIVCKNPNGGRGPIVNIESSVALSGFTWQNGGTVIDNSSGTLADLVLMGGEYLKGGAGALTAAKQHAGYFDYQSTGTMDAISVLGGTFDLSRGLAARTVTLAYIHPNARYLVDYNIATITTEKILADELSMGPLP